MGVVIPMIDMAEFYILIGVAVAYIAGMMVYDRLGKKSKQ